MLASLEAVAEERRLLAYEVALVHLALGAPDAAFAWLDRACEERSAWLAYVGHEARAAIAKGVDLQGICIYPIVNHPGWDDDRHCHNGLWDYADNDGRRAICRSLAVELKRQQQLFAEQQEESTHAERVRLSAA